MSNSDMFLIYFYGSISKETNKNVNETAYWNKPCRQENSYYVPLSGDLLSFNNKNRLQ